MPDIVGVGAHDVAQVAQETAELFMTGLRVRSIVYLNVCAVTGSLEGGEKRNPFRIVNV